MDLRLCLLYCRSIHLSLSLVGGSLVSNPLRLFQSSSAHSWRCDSFQRTPPSPSSRPIPTKVTKPPHYHATFNSDNGPPVVEEMDGWPISQFCPPSLRPKPNPKTEKLLRKCGKMVSVVEDKEQVCSTRASGAGKWELGEA